MPKIISLLFLVILAHLPVMAGGFLLLEKKVRCATCPPIQEYLMDLQAQETKVNIDHRKGIIITTSIQTFYNQSNKKLGGQFVFPLPPQADPNNLSFSQNGQAIFPQKLSEEEAFAFIKTQVEQQETPALLEVYGQDLYVITLESLQPYKDTNIKVVYSEPLIQKESIFEYVYPIDLYQSNRIPIAEAAFEVKIESSHLLRNIYSPTHPIESAFPETNKGICSFEATDFVPTCDFAIQFSTGGGDLGANMLAFREVQTKDGHFYLEISPATEMKTLEIVEKDITFVLDCSGSMVGEKMEQARRALTFCVENLNPNDRFNIVTFSTDAMSLYSKPKTFNENTLLDARAYINSLKATGGTNMEAALKLALNIDKEEKRPFMVVFITDGKPTIGVTKVEPLIKLIKDINVNKAKIFTFGIGDDLNTRLLQRIVEATKAHLTYIGTNEDIELKISSFYTKVSSPVLTDVTLKIEGSHPETIYPENLPDLYMGNPLLIFGKYAENPATKLTIQGKMKNGQTRQFDYNLQFNESPDNDFIPPIWASRRIGSILDEMRKGTGNAVKDNKLKTELATLARKYGILTPYTIHLTAMEEKNDPKLPNLLSQNNFDDDLLTTTKTTYQQMLKEEEGASSVQSSRAVNKMIQVNNLWEIAPAQDKLNLLDKKEQTIYFAQQIKTMGGIALYQTKNGWMDSKLTTDSQVTQKLVFNSAAYYQLLMEQPDLSDYFAIGKNVDFIFEDQYYQVRED